MNSKFKIKYIDKENNRRGFLLSNRESALKKYEEMVNSEKYIKIELLEDSKYIKVFDNNIGSQYQDIVKE